MSVYDNKTLLLRLRELGVINEDILQSSSLEASQSNRALGSVLLQKDLISDENLGKLVSDILSLPFIRLSSVVIPADILGIVPEVVAKRQKVIAFKKDAKGLHLAMSDPKNLEILELIKKKTGLPQIIYYATEKDIDEIIVLYSKNIGLVFDEIMKKNIEQATGAVGVEPPIIKIVETIITYAYQNKASDIHIEALDELSLVRFRIDGILHDIVKLPLDLHPRIVTRVKVLSRLRTDEHQAAQDGKIQFDVEISQGTTEELDIRVSIIPATHGEKIVMRLLSSRSRQFSLEDLGFRNKDLERVRDAYQNPYGMILSTGPTGSGKTTTMYAVLKLLNRREVNIATIEDPVEYEIEGITQIQVNPRTNLTFAAGLRSILRQDPNIILVGEIRDEETADIAVNAALTGHLVLSTVHTNDAATTIPRLIDMGVEPFLISSTVNVIVAQRLVRKIHSVCRVSEEIELERLKEHIDEKTITKVFGEFTPGRRIRIYRGKGCNIDHDTGYEGRVGVYEVLRVDEEIKRAIVDRKDSSVIAQIAVKNGMTTMIEDGLEKVKEGITTLEEVLRVIKE